jgi:hypothetical protein
MCGIFAFLGNSISFDKLIENGNKIRARGPDSTTYLTRKYIKKFNKNLYDLSNNLIPTYLDQRTKMNNNVNSDLSGNELLYFRNQRIPTLREQTAFDANEGGFMQNSLYVLGTMTAVSMLILAISIARE